MKQYLMSIIGAVLVAVFSDVVLSEKWSKYIKIITGLIIIGSIITPLEKLNIPAMEDFFGEAEQIAIDGDEYQKKLIIEDLCKKIREDIKIRLRDEFNIEADIEVSVGVNENNEITGVRTIRITGDKIGESVKKRLDEIYAPEEVIIDEY